MINISFASFKNARDTNAVKQNITKKHQYPIPPFRSIADSKHLPVKRFDNQQNTLTNSYQTQFPKKNLVKVQKSGKKYGQKPTGYRSPAKKNWEAGQSAVVPKILQHSNYNRIKNEEGTTIMTPSLNKNTRSFKGQDPFNGSFLTEKPRTVNGSEQGSISSNKTSFNDSFHLYATNMSCQEDQRTLRDKMQFVNSSVQLCNDQKSSINQFPLEKELKTMKKCTNYFNNGQSVLKDLQAQSATSSVASSVTSIKFSQKFKHYKKRMPQQSIKPSKQGFSLKDFKLLQEIGSGKYGKVYLARYVIFQLSHATTGFICALKSVSKKIIKEEELQIPFMREVKIQLYLNHPNIVKLFGIFHDNENVYLIMEYCSGNHLFKLIRQRKHFTQDQILQVLSDVYEAVSYIHCNGVIHRDLKPQNVVIEHGVYKLCDFGWAAYACGDTRTTFCGTPLYICPEVLKGEEYNEKADIWGLGIVTYQLTFGRVPFAILNQSDLMKIIKDPVYFPIRGQASQKLVPLVRRMLSKNSSERPSLNEILMSDLFANFHDRNDGYLCNELEMLY